MDAHIVCHTPYSFIISIIHGVFSKLDAFTALSLRGPERPLLQSAPAKESMRILPIAQHDDDIRNERNYYVCSQITGGVENTAPLHVNTFRNIIVSLKSRYKNPSCTCSTPDTNFQ
jgi:hypothetical protein